jgi:CheY-like chemotaxis protein
MDASTTIPRRFNALVVDDEALVRDLVRKMMEVMGWDSEGAASHAQARVLLQAKDYDVLIADYHMPCGNAYHFICGLRRDGIGLPAIVMSGDAPILRLAPQILTIAAVLVKPFGSSNLRAALAAALQT